MYNVCTIKMDLQEMKKAPDYFVTCQVKIYSFMGVQAGDWVEWGQKDRSVVQGARDWVRGTWIGETSISAV